MKLSELIKLLTAIEVEDPTNGELPVCLEDWSGGCDGEASTECVKVSVCERMVGLSQEYKAIPTKHVKLETYE